MLWFVSGLPHGGWPDANSDRPSNIIHSLPCINSCRLFIHNEFFEPLGLHLLAWSELGRSRSFQPTRHLRMQWSWALDLMCEVALGIMQYCIFLPNISYLTNRMSIKHWLLYLLKIYIISKKIQHLCNWK